MPLDNGGDEIVGEWRPVGRGLRIPGEQDAEDLLLGEVHCQFIGGPLVHLAAEVAGRPLPIRAHAAIEPLLEGQVDVQVDGADQAMRRAARLLRP